MTQTDSNREAFEKWARVNLAHLGGPFLRDCNDIEPEHTYQDPNTEFAWTVWQAATAHNKEKLRAIRDACEMFLHDLNARALENYENPHGSIDVGIGKLLNFNKAIATLNEMIGDKS